MPSSGMLHRVALVGTAVVPNPPILVTLMMEALSSSEPSVLTRATRRNIPEDGILQYTNCWTRHFLCGPFVTDREPVGLSV
jgi:hypothetical protein